MPDSGLEPTSLNQLAKELTMWKSLTKAPMMACVVALASNLSGCGQSDQQDAENESTESVTNALDGVTGIAAKWADGNVTYSVTNVTSSADKAAVDAGIGLWRAVAPGLHFTKLTTACPGTNSCLNFVTGSDTFSNTIGRPPNTADVSLQAGISTFGISGTGAIAHEVGHALGLFHEHQRRDRDLSVQIMWGRIWGCLNTATKVSGCGPLACEGGSGTPRQNAIANGCCTSDMFLVPDDGFGGNDPNHPNAAIKRCYQYGNFDNSSTTQAARSFYDFDSIMGSTLTGYLKETASGNTIEPLVSVPPDANPGQRDHLSLSDISGMNAMYPVAAVQNVLFRNTGNQRLSQLTGRELDIDVSISCSGGGISTGATINTGLLSEGTTTFSCTIQSPMWTLGYVYPNTTVTTWPSTGLETFNATVSTHVLNPGLIAGFVSIG